LVSHRSILFLSTAALCLAGQAQAQTSVEPPPSTTKPVANGKVQSTADTMFSDIVVTATKKTDAANVQTVAIAVTAFNADQMKALNFKDISSIGTLIPNAVLDGVGTFKGLASFSIRGQPQQDSIPTVDPSVGTFVDGMYLGVNAGVIFDTFDLESIQVLRGPQGILFGRNVVGGAVVVTTKPPSKRFSADFNVDVNSGLRGTGAEYTTSGVVTGPLSDNLQLKVAGYYSKDQGWFRNSFNGKDYGKSRTWLARAALAYQPTDTLDMTLRYEHGDITGEGVPAQSQVNESTGRVGEGIPYGSYRIHLNNLGSQMTRWDQAIHETNLDVGFGDGRITNIVAWRKLRNNVCFDFDASRQDLFNFGCVQSPAGSAAVIAPGGGLHQEQFSEELRYAGRFNDIVDLTTGLYYFDSDLTYSELRSINSGATRQSGGGIQNQSVFGLFLNLDADVTDKLTITLGGRYTHEFKKIELARLASPKPGATPAGYCVYSAGNCPIDFRDDHSWNSVDFKIGAEYKFSSSARAYAFWNTGSRAGGYNIRVSSLTEVPGPVNPERVDNYEIGLKTEPTRNVKLNVGAFYSKDRDLQRTVLGALIVNGIGTLTQIRANTADSTIWGIEADASARIGSRLFLSGSFGYVNASYDRVIYDLSGDGKVDQKDLDLKIPRTPKITYAATAGYDLPLGASRSLGLTLTYSYIGSQFASDSNLGYLPARKNLDFNLTYKPGSDAWSISVYGRNITNNTHYLSDLQLPANVGSTYTTLAKGRQIGLRGAVKLP